MCYHMPPCNNMVDTPVHYKPNTNIYRNIPGAVRPSRHRPHISKHDVCSCECWKLREIWGLMLTWCCETCATFLNPPEPYSKTGHRHRAAPCSPHLINANDTHTIARLDECTFCDTYMALQSEARGWWCRAVKPVTAVALALRRMAPGTA